jgi:hypothetical protein
MRAYRRHDSQVLDWQRRAAANGGEPSTRGSIALDRFMQRSRAADITAAYEWVLPLVGKNFNAARTPLYAVIGSDPSGSVSFNDGDYSETVGLTGVSAHYLQTGITPSTDMQIYDSHGCAYLDKTGTLADLIYGSANGAGQAFYLYPKHGTDTYTDHWNRYSGSGRTQHTDSMAGGLWLSDRSASNRHDLYKGNSSTSFASAANATGSSGVRPTYEVYAMAGNEVGSAGNWFLSGACQWLSFGRSFSSSEATDYFNAVQEFQEFLGRES